MSLSLVPPSSPNGRVQSRQPPFVCLWSSCAPSTVCLRLTGELDVATAPRLRSTLAEAQANARLVVLDLRELDFIDSLGVCAIVEASARGRNGTGRLVLLRGMPSVDRLFALTESFADVEIVDLEAGEPTAGVLARLPNPAAGLA